ncbi:MAG: TIGR03619 family F420-dependent LLM class oxidoreductase [Actinomycetota bacterium]|nr:TIGR03619 family F420-dependent LLM class oxidoreductase [Acidimicrobiia bacterium]MDQ3294399.1 TIGR03619 family F420-dependent LLM class oxidoreductase [Actinomycetota bacterium]
MRLGLGLPMFGEPPAGGWRGLLDVARHADAAGIDRLVVVDHVVLGADVDTYPWGRFPTGPDADWLAPLTLLTAIAAATERIRLATGILIAPLRPAPLLAKETATLDVLSGGRLDLGVGTGWHRAELEALGVDHDARGRVLTDTIAACRKLWEDAPASFESATVSFHDVWCRPAPVQPRLPVWFSGTLTRRNLDRIVTLGDGWIPIMGSTVDDVAAGAATLTAAFEAAGRDPSTFTVHAALPVVRDEDGRADPVATMAALPAYEAAGATDVQLPLKVFCAPDLHDAGAAIDALAAARSAAA